ncbi:MAG: DUF4276 family protein [Candidatus Thiodiazotropha sp. (ex Dulcina madagascariensis)]|nr:DUF4276 family protein [Candidatus Thiodiazotropha sp. (ex Dulcina madagascariensis)]
MTQIVFFLEEPSAREMLRGLLPRLLPQHLYIRYIVFEGKQDLEKRLPLRLRAWRSLDTHFVVLRDQDNGDCRDIKASLAAKCTEAGQPNTLVRIACHELESFYLGDLAAVADAVGPGSLVKQQRKAKYRDPDRLANPSQELKKLAPSYQKISGSRAIGPLLSIEQNHSLSFKALINGVQRLVGEDAYV